VIACSGVSTLSGSAVAEIGSRRRRGLIGRSIIKGRGFEVTSWETFAGITAS
jgi:hypothetical protein